MNEFDHFNQQNSTESPENDTPAEQSATPTEQSYNYTSNQIIQDSVYSDNNSADNAHQNNTYQYSQQYTYQSQRSDHTRPNNSYNGGYTAPQQTVYTPQPVTAAKKKERKPVSIATVIICMILTAAISSIASISAVTAIVSNKNGGNNLGSTTTTETNIITQNLEMTTVEAVAKAVTPSVVCIEVEMQVKNVFGSFFGYGGNSQVSDSVSYGSGVIYSTDGYIITNYHVVSGIYESNVLNSKVKVYLADDNENAIEAKIIGYNSAADLAVLKIEKSGLTAAQIGDSSELVLGQTVVAIGNPGGIEFAGSVTSGIISGLDRKLSVDSVTMNLIQTDAAINPGNSGGALVDASGRLVGVPNVKISADGYEGMGFCIPVNTAVEICNDIIKNGMNSESNETPYLGVEINNNFTGGAYVARVTEGGPAEDAGIKSGDIIISFGNEQVSGYTDLINAINKCKPGDTVTVGIYRNGSKGSVTVTLGSNGS